MINLTKQDDVFVLTMDEGENRWNTTFVRAYAAALDEVEASEGPAALVTASGTEKFFSNGLDLDWRMSDDPDHPGGDREAFAPEFMTLMGRIITLPVPTVAAVNGHAFGAGFMCALCHDLRFQRADRGFMCANEVDIGMVIPNPELALFRHKMSASAYVETVLQAKRWSGPLALEAGITQQIEPLENLLPAAIQRAQELARLGANRKVYNAMKEAMYGTNAALNTPHGAAHMLKNSADFH